MGAYISLAAFVLQVVFLGAVVSAVAVSVHRYLARSRMSRPAVVKAAVNKTSARPVSNVDAARARAAKARADRLAKEASYASMGI